MVNLKERFMDGVTAPCSETIHLGDAEFIDIANNVFSFDGAEILSSELSLPEKRVDFRLNYIAAMGLVGMVWRKLRLHFGEIDNIVFSYSDAELGFPHEVKRHVDLEYVARNNPSLFPKLESALWRDHRGGELVEISFEKYPYFLDRILGKKKPSLAGKAMFDWELHGDWPRILIDTIECREIEIEFLTPAADRPWPE